MRKVISLFLSFLLMFCSPVFATVYYVDNTNGSDSNNGTSVATAFLTMSNLTTTNFLKCGDHVEILPSNTFSGTAGYFTINSNGCLNNPIVFERYQAAPGTDSIFSGATAATSIAGWTGWTNTSGDIYESNIQVPWTVQGVIVDGSYNLLVNTSGSTSIISYRYYQSGGYVYVWLPDNSSPAGHTIEFTGKNQTNLNIGSITTNGNYLQFKHIEVYGATTYGWFTPNIGIHVDNSSSYFSGRESLYCATYAQTVGCYNSTFNNDIFEYSNGDSQSGWGQNVTIEGSFNDVNNSTIAYGGMAGFDFLNYNASTNIPTLQTPASYNRLMNSTIFQNSRRSLQNADGSGYDPQIYNDGGAFNQMINITVKGNEINDYGYSVTGQNAAACIALSTEHPTTSFPHDIYMDNIQVSNCTYYAVITEVLSGATTPWYNVWLMNSTLYGDSGGVGGGGDGGFLTSWGKFNTALGQTLHLYNNIMFQNSAATGAINLNTGITDSNYNDYAGGTTNFIKIGLSSASFATWQGDGQDANSISSNPDFVSTTSPYDFHLQRTSLGQAHNSPAIGIGDPGYANQFFNIYNLGTTRTDGIIDSSLTPDIGYHYNYYFGSSNNWNRGYGEQYN